MIPTSVRPPPIRDTCHVATKNGPGEVAPVYESMAHENIEERLAGGLDNPEDRVDGPVREEDFLPGGRFHSMTRELTSTTCLPTQSRLR